MTRKQIVAIPGGTALAPALAVQDDDDTGVAAEALEAALGAYAANATKVDYHSASQVHVENRRGSSSLIALKLDGGVYTATGPLTVDLTVAGRGGILDGVEAVSTWYYAYAVPGLVAGQLTVGCSANDPSVGPVGFSAWYYVGAFYNDAAGDIRRFTSVNRQRAVYVEYLDSYNSGGPTGPDGAIVDFDLSAFIPKTAGQVTIMAEVQVNAAGTQYEWSFYCGAALNEFIHLETDPTQASTTIYQFTIPVLTPQHIWRQLIRTLGAGNAQSVYCGVLGWEDEWV